MPTLGLGCFLGSHCTGLDASKVARRVTELLTPYGLFALGFGESLPESGAVNTWPATVGNALSPISGTARSVVATHNGRRFCDAPSTTSTGVGLAWIPAITYSYAFSAIFISDLPFANGGYAIARDGYSRPALSAAGAGSNQWYNKTGYEIRCDGSITNTASLGVHIYESSDTTPSIKGVKVCGLGSEFPNFDFLGGVGCYGVCTAIPPADVRAALVQATTAFYRVTI